MSLPPLPAGWDRDRVYSIDDIDARIELPGADQELIQAYIRADSELTMARLRATVDARNNSVNVSCVVAGLSTLEEADRAIAEEMGLIDYDMATQKDLFDIAKSMHDVGAEAFGFVVFKTWGYKEGEREKWDAFWRKWIEVSDRTLRDMGAVGDLREGFPGRLQWLLVDHEDMDGKGINEVRDLFAGLVEEAEETIPLGLDLDLCLMIDEGSMDSLLNREDTSTLLAPEEEKGNIAFVWGVDVNYGDDDEEESEEEDDKDGEDGRDGEYPGHFKISVNVLIPELWHSLNAQSIDELYPGEGQIYGGIIGNYPEAIAE